MPSKMKKYTPPFPTSPEMLRGVAKHIGTKSLVGQKTSNQLDDYVRKGFYVHETHNRLLHEAIIDPLRTLTSCEFATQAEKCLNRLFSRYHDLIANTYVGGKSRKDLAPLLLEFFSSHGTEALNALTRSINGPEIPSWLTGVKLLPLTLKWLPDNYVGYRDALNSYLEPLSTKNITQLKTIEKMTQELELSKSINKKEIREISSILVIARTVDSLAKQYKDQPIYKKLTQATPTKTYTNFLSSQQTATQSPYFYANHAARLALDLMSKGHLSDGELVVAKKHLTVAKETYRINKLPNSLLYLNFWGEAKYTTIVGDKKLSLAMYEKAFIHSLYTAGDEQCQIIKEALAVAAMNDANRSIFKKFKNQAIAFNLYRHFQEKQPKASSNDNESQSCSPQKHIPQGNKTSRTKDNVVEDWEIESWRELFFELFPHNRWGLKEADIPIVIVDESIVQPDLRHPNREIQMSIGKPQKMPQLVFFAERKNLKAVKALLEAGADILNLSKNGESAILMALASNTPESLSRADKKLFQLLLRNTKEKQINNADCPVREMINTPDIKKQITPLGYAIDSGDVDIVQALIELGASVDRKFGFGQTTPLYHCINIILVADDFRQTFETQFLSMPESDFIDLMRRYNAILPDHIRNNRREILRHPLFEKYVLTNSSVNRKKFIHLAKTLLENGASPNSTFEKDGMSEFTPLMYTITHNDIELFKLLLEFGGDTSRSCYMPFSQEKLSCKTLAELSGSREILQLINSLDRTRPPAKN